MADRVPEYAGKSLAYFIRQNIADFSNRVYFIDGEFDHDYVPDPTDPTDRNKRTKRPRPYCTVELVEDALDPFTVGNILYETELLMFIKVFADTMPQVRQLTPDVRQALVGATNASTSGIGITLYNFAVEAGGFYENAGTLQVDLTRGRSEYFGSEDGNDLNSLRHRSITPITLSAFKDATATLLENKGRVNLTDS